MTAYPQGDPAAAGAAQATAQARSAGCTCPSPAGIFIQSDPECPVHGRIPTVCSLCERPVQARGLCAAHYAKWRRDRPTACRYCGGQMGSEPGKTHAACLADRRDRWASYRQRVLDAYGAKCSCCGEATPAFLTIDHTRGDGRQHRASLGKGSNRVMLEIIAEGFPPTYRVLCYNCNSGRERAGGFCPHIPLWAIAETDDPCPGCGGDGLVCEYHPARPWGGGDACCGGAGMACQVCCSAVILGAPS